jgi:hypothetical protein
MWGKTVRYLVVAGVSVVAAATLAAGPALAGGYSLSLRGLSGNRISAGRPEAILITGHTNDSYGEVVVYRDPARCETTDAAQAKLPYVDQIKFKPYSGEGVRLPDGFFFAASMRVEHEHKGEHRLCGFLVGSKKDTEGKTLVHAGWTYTVI